MAKLPDNRRPYDPAKAARDRASAAAEKTREEKKLVLEVRGKRYLRPT